jgi:hypothetical protein
MAEAETALGALLVEAGRHEEAEALLAAAVAALDGGERAREKAAAEKHLAEARKHRAAVVANR